MLLLIDLSELSHYYPCPPGRDSGSCVSGLVFIYICLQLKRIHFSHGPVTEELAVSVCRSVYWSVIRTKCERLFVIPLLPTRSRLGGVYTALLSLISRLSTFSIHLSIYVSVFLVADTQLYKRLCPSVGWSVGWSVRGHESKSEEMSVLEHF